MFPKISEIGFCENSNLLFILKKLWPEETVFPDN